MVACGFDRAFEGAAWLADHPVLEALRRRREVGDLPGSRSDGLRIGLAIEGGGMRGVVSGVMLCALDDLGVTNAFDAVYAESCGARAVPRLTIVANESPGLARDRRGLPGR